MTVFDHDRTTLIRLWIDVMVSSPSKKSWRTWNVFGFLENYWWQTCLLPIQHEQSICQHYQFDQKTLKCKLAIGTRMNTRLWTSVRRRIYRSKKKGWRCSLDRISKLYHDGNQKNKLKGTVPFCLDWLGFPCLVQNFSLVTRVRLPLILKHWKVIVFKLFSMEQLLMS